MKVLMISKMRMILKIRMKRMKRYQVKVMERMKMLFKFYVYSAKDALPSKYSCIFS